MTAAPKVTVLIPVYNREAYVGEAIDSVLAQTFTDFELLMVDDGSTDRSREVVQSYRDPRIRLVCNGINTGISKTRNTGIRLAYGEYLAFLDSDDWAYPERLAKQVAFLDRHPDYAAVGAWIEWMDMDGGPLGRTKRKPTSPEDIAALRLFQSGIENSASMARTRILREYEYQKDYDASEDFDIWAQMAAKYKLGTLPAVLVRRRHHPQQLTREKAKSAQERRVAIYAAQLDTLGVAFTTTDLEHHSLLRSMRKQGFTPDVAYLEWADTWLQQLRAANLQAACYPEPAFSHVLGRLWLQVCWYASRRCGWTAWRWFRQSPLRGYAWPGLRKHVALYFPFSWRIRL